MTLVCIVLLAALIFEYINGFHDAANAIATVVSTKVMTPRQAIAMAAVANLFGALIGTAVATTIGTGLVDASVISTTTILDALVAAILWGLLTWWLGLPSSSSHALIGGLCGAALAASGLDWNVLKWDILPEGAVHHTGLWPKVLVPMILSPLAGFVGGFLVMLLILIVFQKITPHGAKTWFGKLQIVSAACMAVSHGSNDAQKTMGIIALTLFTATAAGTFDALPAWLGFLHTPEFAVAKWNSLLCAGVMAAGTAAGGWRIIRTMGHKMVKLQPVHGFAAETTAAGIIYLASTWGIPVSTTHVISTSIMGVGSTKRLSAVKWGIIHRIVWAWVLTIPITALLAFFIHGAAKHIR